MSQSSYIPALLLSSLLVACGHRATEKECEEILERSAALKLQQKGVTDPEELERRVADARIEQAEKLSKTCVGRRITNDAMECIRKAESPAALDTCLD